MNGFELTADYKPAGDQPDVIEKLVTAVRSGNTPATLKGVTGSGKTFTLANVIQQTQLPTLVISHNKTLAGQLYQEFKELFPENAVEYYISYYDYYQPEAYIPSKDLLIEKEYAINEEIDRHRASTISALLERNDVIVIATVSCLFKMSNPAMFNSLKLHFRKEQAYNRKVLINCLINQHYFRNDEVLLRSSFRIKGDSIEIWPSSLKTAYRIEFNWGQIGKIWKIDPLTFEKIEEVEQLMIYPVGNFFIAKNKIQQALQSIDQELHLRVKELKSNNRALEARRLKERTEYDMELIKNTGTCMGIENYSYHLTLDDENAGQAVLMDFFPKDFLTIVDESHITLSQIKAMYKGNESRKSKLIEYGFRLPSIQHNKPLSFEEFEEKAQVCIFNSATPNDYELKRSKLVAQQQLRPTGLLNPLIRLESAQGYFDKLTIEIQQRVEKKERVLITTLTKKSAESLTNDLLFRGFKACYLHSEIETMERINILKDLRSGNVEVLVGINILREGLDLPEVSLVAIIDADKQGFLRSSVSLTQIMGRVSRNVNGTVIMFAESVTSAMKEAIEENTRIRLIQEAYNKEHNITPTTIRKKLADVVSAKELELEKVKLKELEIIKGNYDIHSAGGKQKLIEELEALIKEHAENMNFFEATLVKKELDALMTSQG